MSAELIRQKARERHFLEQLLDGKKLENYKIPVPIKAELRKYQQVGLLPRRSLSASLPLPCLGHLRRPGGCSHPILRGSPHVLSKGGLNVVPSRCRME